MKGLWLVAKRELREQGRSKGFLISSAISILIILALILVPRLLGGDPTTFRVGSIGEGNDAIVDAAAAFAAEAADSEDREPDRFELVGFEDRASAEAALSGEEVDAVLVDGETVVVQQQGFGGSNLVDALQQAAGAVRLQTLVASDPQLAQEVVEVLSSDPLHVESQAGDDGESEERGAIAYGGMLLLYMAILIYGATVLSGVSEEKTNRVVEVLLAALRPWQMLGGKVLGIGLLGLIQFALTAALAYVAIRLSGAVSLPSLEGNTVLVLVIWFVIGFAIYATLYAAAGSLSGRAEDAQSASFPMTMIAVVGFLYSFSVLNDPDTTVARITSFIPFTAPFVVPIRNALGAIGAMEHVLAVVAMIGWIVLLLRIAARIYAGGLLQFGSRMKLKEAWRRSD